MTILEASSLIWKWFSTHDTFSEDNLKEIVLVSEDYGVDWAIFVGALNELEKTGILRKVTISQPGKARVIKELWVLFKKFNTYEQTVLLSADTCLTVAEVINSIGDTFEEDGWQSNPTDIKEIDIVRVTNFCKGLINKYKENNGLDANENS